MQELPITSPLTQLLAQYPPEREQLIPLLQEVQAHEGYLSPESIRIIAAYLDLSEHEVYGVATFYAQFRFVPPGLHHIKVCEGTACHVRGSDRILEAIGRELSLQPGETSADGTYSLERVACFGSCALAPIVVLDDKVYGRMSEKKTQGLLEEQS